MVHLNATYKTIEESIGRLLPRQTKEQLSLLEGLLRCSRHEISRLCLSSPTSYSGVPSL